VVGSSLRGEVDDHEIGPPPVRSAVAGDAAARTRLQSMTNDDPKKNLAEDERRIDTRRPGTDQAKIRLGDRDVIGHVENLSDGGLFVVLDGPLTLEIELGAELGVPLRPARLVRCQALPGGKSGWGLQFDIDGSND